MKRNRFAETAEFTDAIIKNWRNYVNNRGFTCLNLASPQMKEYELAISVHLAAGNKNRMDLSLYNPKHRIELFSMSPADNTADSIRYAIEFLLGYCKDVMIIPLYEQEN